MLFADPADFRSMDPWRMFRIMAEFVEGFDEMAKINPAVSIFGSARTKPDDPYYRMAEDVASRLAEHGYNIITGGGPGIMEAANKGSMESGKGVSVGLNIDLPFEQHHNPYIQKLLTFRYFFCRKVMFTKYSSAVVVMPGGFGTLDEMFENLTLAQTNKIPNLPIVLMGRRYWQGLIDWLGDTMRDRHEYISSGDLGFFHLTDDPEDAVEYIVKHIKQPDEDSQRYKPKKTTPGDLS